MIKLKTKKDIEVMAKGGAILSRILKKIAKAAMPGVETAELEKMARKLIKEAGGEPAFLGYDTGTSKYPAALCVSVNDAVVHTPATFNYKIKEGDVVSLDLGLRYQGLCTDMATTVIAKTANIKTHTIVGIMKEMEKAEKLIRATREALKKAIRECKINAPISAIGKKVQQSVEAKGFTVIRDLVGHGVGFGVHEDPIVPNYYDKNTDKIKMQEGLVIAIEPMITIGNGKVVLGDDGFTWHTADGQPAAHFEATIAITKKGPKILTPIL